VVAEARDIAEHRHRGRGRGGAAGARLGRGDQRIDPNALLLFLIIFRVDAAALLGAGDRAPR